MRHFDFCDDTLEDSRTLIEEGSINYGPLSLCKIKRLIGSCYQVDLMYKTNYYTNLFIDFDKAYSKFIELKESLVNSGYKDKK